MKISPFFLFMFWVSLSGCSIVEYRESGAEFRRVSFGSQTQISKFAVGRDNSGNITFDLIGYQSDQVQALGAISEGVAKGLSSGVKP